MCCILMNNLFVLLYVLCLSFSGLPSSHGNMIGTKVLNVGKEMQKETLPLQMGSYLYQLQGLKSYAWYEVKISYPASIPASFSIQLKRANSDSRLDGKRKLLNTEKLIFKTDDLELPSIQDRIHVLVTVEPAGVVAIPHAKEREVVIFNIVCDELVLGIPHKAWWVGFCVLLCLGSALIIPRYLPSYLLQKDCDPQSVDQSLLKES